MKLDAVSEYKLSAPNPENGDVILQAKVQLFNEVQNESPFSNDFRVGIVHLGPRAFYIFAIAVILAPSKYF